MATAAWLGHSAWLVEGKSAIVLIDPFLDENPMAPCKARDIARADIVLVSHDHFDHLGDAPAISKRTGAMLVGTFELATAVASEHGIKSEGMNIGGSLTIGGVTVHMTPAFHTSGRGQAAGWVVEIDGVRIYHSGDTSLFSDMKLIGDMFRPDLACLPIGDRFTMGPAAAARAVDLIRPRIVAPMHYNTWPPIAQDPEKFRALVGSAAEVAILKPGEKLEVKPRA